MAKPDYSKLMGPKSAPDDGAMPMPGDDGAGDEGDHDDAGQGEVSDEEMMHAKDMGFDAKQAAALKRFVRSCYQDEEASESPAEEAAEPPPGGGDAAMAPM